MMKRLLRAIRTRKDIDYMGGPMIKSEVGYLCAMVREYGIKHVFLLSLTLMKQEYRKKVMKQVIRSHFYFKKLYPYPTNVKMDLKEKGNYNGLGFIINEYGFEHLYHSLLLFVEKKDMKVFVENLLSGTDDFRQENDDIYPVGDTHPGYIVQGT